MTTIRLFPTQPPCLLLLLQPLSLLPFCSSPSLPLNLASTVRRLGLGKVLFAVSAGGTVIKLVSGRHGVALSHTLCLPSVNSLHSLPQTISPITAPHHRSPPRSSAFIFHLSFVRLFFPHFVSLSPKTVLLDFSLSLSLSLCLYLVSLPTALSGT